MDATDVDENGKINLNEFDLVTMHMNKVVKEDHLFATFRHFDIDNSGYITTEKLQQVTEKNGMGDAETINEIIR